MSKQQGYIRNVVETQQGQIQATAKFVNMTAHAFSSFAQMGLRDRVRWMLFGTVPWSNTKVSEK